MPQESSKILSIVIPVFNEINFLNKLFEQIETYFNKDNIEIIVVDDFSSDGSRNKIDKIKAINGVASQTYIKFKNKSYSIFSFSTNENPINENIID